MRVTMVALGSRGDVQPYVALGLGLDARGYDVRITCLETYRGLVEQAGLACAPLGRDAVDLLASDEGQAWLSGGRNAWKFLRSMLSVGGPLMETLLPEVQAACDDAELIVFGAFGFIGLHLAEQRGVPACAALLQPLEPTGAFPSIFTPGGRSLGTRGNRITHRTVEHVSWQVMRPTVNRLCRERLGIDPMARLGPLRRMRRLGIPVLYGYSPAVLPRPLDWPANVHVTGYWFLDPEAAWAPPPALAEFLAAGPPPVYVGFGSMIPGDPRSTWEIVVEALGNAGVRGVLAGAPPELAEPGRTHVVAEVPHTWLFPRVAAVVHHGGAGTLAAALRAGVPAVTCPFFSDQPFWGERLHRLGAGTRPLPARELTPRTLGDAIATAAGSPAMRRRAGEIGERIRAEDGVGIAVKRVEQWLDRARL
jgi:UDP:flavonoid glycosyltransferase YjiC (YdhE family)